MADFTDSFWSLYIALLTVLGIAGCAILLWSQSKTRVEMQPDENGKVGTTGHTWDGVTELNNPMPRWWMWLFYLTIVFAVVYLVLYPGLGAYKGRLGWASSGEYQAEKARAEQEYGPLFDQYLKQDLKAVAADPQAHAIGERLFMTYCAQCHGSDARGNKGFPNLTDHDWLYGGAPEVIKTTIMNGRNGVMPPLGGVIGGEKEIANVANYVLSLSGSRHDEIKAAAGKEKFAVCASCHGADGKGNQAMGTPNLADKIWLYGGRPETIMETIRSGRNNTMPAFHDFLGEAKVHVLAAYVWSLSNGSSEAK